MLGQKKVPSRDGGIEVVVGELAPRMVQKGHKVTLYNRDGHFSFGFKKKNFKHEQFNGVECVSVPTLQIRGLSAMVSSFFASVMAAFGKYDVVHFHAEGPAFFSFIPKLFRKKIVVTIHGLDWQRAKWGRFASWYIRMGEKNAVRYADEIIVLSQNLKNYFETKYGRKTVYIPNGASKPEVLEANEIKKRWGLEKDSYILYVGRIVPEKGLHYLIEATKEIKEKKLVVVGKHSDTKEYYDKITNDSKDVLFVGFQEGTVMQELYSNAYIYCLPSDLEGMPLTLLEAMSYGNCCLTSDIAECAEVVEDKAVLFTKGKVKSLREKINWLISHPEEVADYKQQAQEYICDKYSWDEVNEKTLSLYNSVLRK